MQNCGGKKRACLEGVFRDVFARFSSVLLYMIMCLSDFPSANFPCKRSIFVAFNHLAFIVWFWTFLVKYITTICIYAQRKTTHICRLILKLRFCFDWLWEQETRTCFERRGAINRHQEVCGLAKFSILQLSVISFWKVIASLKGKKLAKITTSHGVNDELLTMKLKAATDYWTNIYGIRINI